MENKSKSVFDQMPPKFAFWAGIVTATAVISLVGLIVMVSVVLGDGSSTTKTNKNSNTNKTTTTNTNTGTAPVAAGTFDLEALRDSNIRGEGDITVVEFSDTECPYCNQFHTTMKQVVEEYDGQVRWAYLHFPLNIHPKAPRQAEATECAADQGEFWAYTDAVFSGTRGIEDAELIALAGELGLDESDFEDCLTNDTYKSRVTADSALAQQMGGTGTPYSLIVDADGNIIQRIPGALPYATVAATLDSIVN